MNGQRLVRMVSLIINPILYTLHYTRDSYPVLTPEGRGGTERKGGTAGLGGGGWRSG